MRNLTPYILAPLMRRTGFRFSKEYRWGVTRWHRLAYRLVDTVGCNVRADGLRPPLTLTKGN